MVSIEADVGEIIVRMTKLSLQQEPAAEEGADAPEGEHCMLRMTKTIDVKTIKQDIQREFNILPVEQLIFFRGLKVENDEEQPLDTPALADIIENAGDDGIMMAFMHIPQRTPPFLEKENLETVNKKKPTLATALHRAVRELEMYVMEELLENEDFAHIDARDRDGQTALHVAVTCGFNEAVEILMKSPRFTNVGGRDADGKNALHYAAFFGNLEMCNLILEHPKFDKKAVQARDKQGHRSYDYAVFNGFYDIALAIHGKFSDIFPSPVRPRRVSEISFEAPDAADILARAAAAREEDGDGLSDEAASDAASPSGLGARAPDDKLASPTASPSPSKDRAEAAARGPAPADPSVSESEQVTGPLTAAVAEAYK